MSGSEIRSLLVQVITSWQVIAVTLAVVLYIALLNYVTKTRRRKPPPPPKPMKIKPNKEEAAEEQDDDNDLGLED